MSVAFPFLVRQHTCSQCGKEIQYGMSKMCMYCYAPIEKAAQTEKTRKLYFQHLMMAPRQYGANDKIRRPEKWEFLTGDVSYTYGKTWFKDDGDAIYVADLQPITEDYESGAMTFNTGRCGFWSNPDSNWEMLHKIIDDTTDWEDFWTGFKASERRLLMWQALNSYQGYESDYDDQEIILVYDKAAWNEEQNEHVRKYATKMHKPVVYLRSDRGIAWWLKVKKGIPTDWGKKTKKAKH